MSSSVRLAVGILGAVAAAVGAVLATRLSDDLDAVVLLAAIGFVLLAAGTPLAHPRPTTLGVQLVTAAWLVGAVGLAVRHGDAEQVAQVAGLALLLEAAAELRAAREQRQRGTAVLYAVAAGMLGAVLLLWPDPGVPAVSALLGIRLLWAGLAVAWSGVRGTFDDDEPFDPGSLRQFSTTFVSGVALVVATTLGATSAWLHETEDDRPSTGPIPVGVPDEPGRLISAEEFTDAVPGGAKAWKMLYTTTREDGVPAVSSALVVVEDDTTTEPRPVIAWAHGTTGISEGCAPSGSKGSVRFSSIPGLRKALDQGWAVVATDYIGLGTEGPHPYLIGEGEGRSVLDSVRAAKELRGLRLADQTVVWGHSQGGGAALWAGILAPSYAPDAHVEGVVGIAPATDLPSLIKNISAYPAGALFSAYVVTAYAANYPDVKVADYLVEPARLPIQRAAGLCVTDTEQLTTIARFFDFSQPYYSRDPLTGPLGRRLRENIPDRRLTVPTLIAQGAIDPLVLAATQTEFVASRCAQRGNAPLEYVTYADREHLNIVATDSPLVPDLLEWTEDRFAGREAPTTC